MNLVVPAISEMSLEKLKETLGKHLVSPEFLRSPLGLSTGVWAFDQSLLWKGFPRGEFSLGISQKGHGLTSLWLSAANQLQSQNEVTGGSRSNAWSAWVQEDEYQLYPSANLNWNQVVVLNRPTKREDFFWILQELISSSIFQLIGCSLSARAFQRHHLVKLKFLAEKYQVALVFLSEEKLKWMHSLCALVFESDNGGIHVHRALHRGTPFFLPEVLTYARPLPQVLESHQQLLG